MSAQARAAAASTEANFEARCATLSRHASVSVHFEDAPITWNTRYGEAELRNRSRELNSNHLVLGLTVAQPTARTSVKHRAFVDPESGRACIAGALTLTLGFSEMTVYLASSLTDPCRRDVVEEHEREHVRIWRNHMRVGARLAKTLIEREFVLPLYADDLDSAVDALKAHIGEVVTPIVDRILAVAHAAQRELDTPASYQTAANRLRACR